MNQADAARVDPPGTIGMLGGGQLGKYALAAASAMGYRTVVLDPDPVAPAGVLANEHLVAPFDDSAALDRLAGLADVVTTEFENPPAATLDRLAESLPVRPGSHAVRVAQDRMLEKRFLVGAGFPVGPHLEIVAGSAFDEVAVSEVLAGGAGGIVKSARLGYDGKGQRRVDTADEVRTAIADLGDVDVVVERRLDLLTEVSVLVARAVDGSSRTWPVAENTHVAGILDVSVVPATVEPGLAGDAVELALEIAGRLDYVGVLAVEMFVVGRSDGGGSRLVVNELAPRPHNSGHWTIDAAATSQFEQQIRAVCGHGLGSTELVAPAAAMVNLLGDRWLVAGDLRHPAWERALEHPDARLHLYGKAEPRPGRKMGHLTVTAESAPSARDLALRLRRGHLAASRRLITRVGTSGRRGRRPASSPRCSNRVTGRSEGLGITPPESRRSARHTSAIWSA